MTAWLSFFSHSGYAFGGDTENHHFLTGKLRGPEDCSSSASKWMEAPRFSTLDQLYAYRRLLPEPDSNVPGGWPHEIAGE